MNVRADRRVGLLLGGVLLMLIVSVGATVALPATDPSLDEAEAVEPTAEQMEGMKLFQGEGCWYCHTQYKRETIVDEEGQATSIDGLSPSMLGIERVGSRFIGPYPAASLAAIRSAHGNSFDGLSDEDLTALLAYITR